MSMQYDTQKDLDAGVVQVSNEMMTKQEFGPDCDINNIMIKYRQTGELEHVREYLGDSIDNTLLGTDFQEMSNKILAARSAFAELPSKFRAQLDNDPANFLTWVSEPGNRPQAEEMGLLPATRKEPEKTPEKAVEPPPTPSEPKSD